MTKSIPFGDAADKKDTPPPVEPVKSEELPKAIVMEQDARTEYAGNTLTFRERQRIKDPHVIRIIVDAGLAYRVA